MRETGLDMIDWKSVMDLLYTKDYNGMLSIEPHSRYWKGKKVNGELITQ